ncbi:hypothetical protein EYF80_025976 [Liparis tanakae]|uniref:Uncharacterized protein n=1 Tax=Liparis tanakae TaxID=230148 RepID=A0A4Z2HFS7_9TELE|nr:hypothetical protein EYF80_025976 [Liparis tanakae]
MTRLLRYAVGPNKGLVYFDGGNRGRVTPPRRFLLSDAFDPGYTCQVTSHLTCEKETTRVVISAGLRRDWLHGWCRWCERSPDREMNKKGLLAAGRRFSISQSPDGTQGID